MSEIKLSAPQGLYLNGMKSKYRAYVGGFGSGKTFVGCLDLITFMAKHPGTRVGYFGPTYPAIRDIFYPTFEEAAHLLGFTVDIKETNKEVHLFRSGNYYGTVICRSMDNPGSIVGFKVSRALTDELDVLSRDKAEQAWNKIAARMRLVIPGVVNSIGVTTTPEGFKFVYEKFKQDPTASYSMVQASTYENEEFLPPDYISSLKETYPSQLIEAYLGGQFVNLTSGTVYHAYKRERCRSRETIKEGEPLFIGQDFNVGKMASTVYVQRPNGWHAVAELSDLFDTPDAIRVINERWQSNGHRIIMYPDASGKNRKSNNASTSDIALLEQAGFDVRANASNPAVKDRVLAMNKALECGKVWVNDAACPNTARGLEQQAYDKNGEPSKDGKIDHMCFHGDQIVYVNGKQMMFKDIPNVGFVMCPDGSWRRYKNGGLIKRDQRMLELTLSNGRIITCTPDHMFITDLGIVVADAILGRTLCDRESFLIANKSLMGAFTIFVECISKGMGLGFIGKFIDSQKARYLVDSMFTILMETGETTIQKTLNCLRQASTPTTTTMGTKEGCQERLLMRPDYGTQAKQVWNGTRITMKKQSIFSMLKGYLFAKFAERNTRQSKQDQTCTAVLSAAQAQEESQGLMMRSLFALNVGRYLSEINTKNQYSAVERAPQVVSVKEVSRSDAYCLTVPSFGCFELCGVAVSNCDASTYPIVYEMPVVKPVAQIQVSMWGRR